MIQELIDIVLLSFFVSLSATLAASLLAVPAAVYLVLNDFRGKRAVTVIVHGMLSVPAVVIGLCCYLAFTRGGVLGPLKLLYTPGAMIIAQTILALPIVVSLTYAGMNPLAKPLRDTFYSLGDSTFRMISSLVYETRKQVFAAVIMAFSRVIGETGMTMMVGGNIKGHTRVMTTTIALETMKGNFELAVVLGIILFSVAILINIVLHVIVGESHAPAM